MAQRSRIGRRKAPRPEFFPSLYSAFFELLLIVLLFVAALLQCLARRLARRRGLPAPCLLCSRLDALLGDPKPAPFGEMLCEGHGAEVSSLAFCPSHRRLADARDMCDGCLVPFVGALRLRGEDPGRRCACCAAPFRSRPPARALMLGQKPVDAVAKAVAFCPVVVDRNSDRSSHVGYGELKITPCSESEVPLSDNNDDNAGALARAAGSLKDELAPTTAFPKNNVSQATADDVVSEKPAQPPALVPEASVATAERKLKLVASSSSVGIVQGLEETNWSQIEAKPIPCAASEITSEQTLPEGLSINSHALEVDVANGEATKVSGPTDINSKMSQITSEKLNPGIRASLPSSASIDLIAGRESSRVAEDLKVRLSQISSSRWSEFPWNDMSSSPRINGQGDEPRLSDASSSTGILNYMKRYESGLDSLDGNLIGEVEGESALDRLKRQIEMDRKSMIILYKELEEERNASAIAANQAMAMINRLQEEKASMHMEALQYLRMMEEQSEYDEEELQKLNDLLADRDKEIQDLEAEVDSYRKQFGFEPLTSRVLQPVGDTEERQYREYTPVSTPRSIRSRSREIGSNLVKNTVGDFEDEKVYISECLKSLEKKLQSFSNSRLSAAGSGPDVQEDIVPDKSSLLEESEAGNGEYVKEPLGNSDQESSQWDNGILENSQKRELFMSKDLSPSIEDSHIVKCSTPSSTQAVQFSIKDALKERTLQSLSYNDRQFRMLSRRNDITALGNEISQLSARLEALEADRSFLDHAVDSLRNGSDGVQFIQEIACHLRELRKIGITRQQQTVA